MREFVNAFVIKTTPELSEKNIREGTPCTVIKHVFDTKWLAVFFNDKNYGDYAVATIDESCLRYDCDVPEYWIEQFKVKMDDPKFYAKTSLNKMRFREYDWVEVTVEKEKYAREGVHKGAVGCIMESCAIKGEWYVIFSDDDTGDDIASIYIKESDLKLIK